MLLRSALALALVIAIADAFTSTVVLAPYEAWAQGKGQSEGTADTKREAYGSKTPSKGKSVNDCKPMDPEPDPAGGCKPSGLRKRFNCGGRKAWGGCA